MSSPARAPRRERASLVPNANNPALLLRLIGLVARGVRRPRALAEVLDVEVRTVHYYTQAGEWLGLLDTREDIQLTRAGLALAVASPAERRRLYAEAAWRTPFVRALMEGRRTLPDRDAIAAFIRSREPDMAERTVMRRAGAVRGLLEPALAHPPDRKRPRGEQLLLPFLAQAPVTAPSEVLADMAAPVDLRAGTEDNPDIYARLLRVLLDHGELSTSQLRAVLDRIGAQDAPLGPYADMAVRRGDARRDGDRLVLTAGAIQRRELAGEGLLVALSDPDYRAWLGMLRAAEAGEDADPEARRDRDRLAARFAHWDRRYFGERLQPETVKARLAAALPGRHLEGVPLAGWAGPEPPAVEAPFVECLDREGLPVCLPAALLAAAPGVSAVNATLRRLRGSPAGVHLPTPVDRRLRWHGGLLHPGERLPSAVPDNLSLRWRALTHAPALAMAAAFLLVDRRSPRGRLRVGADGIVALAGRPRLTLLAALVAFAEAQGWLVARPSRMGDPALADLLERLGIAVRLGRRFVLDEPLFVRLQEDPEGQAVHDALQPLVERVEAWLAARAR